ncbi:hypothetical protein FF36_05380 [Frankia torreyi]|uniref:Uncharacterized protein n=1 Tax=Frankia torreyi TaxID=1856 RepID=A0A0D8BAD3_9ACTN|nr:hypothetical protein FF36_05380 [Frankia torreyi]KQC39812.1 hypothetical protein UK82_03140 [Frankia sp. ACN1ag]KQM02658.1 hypothetical protein FF86_105918 [Frankia sp. CpI1-P]
MLEAVLDVEGADEDEPLLAVAAEDDSELDDESFPPVELVAVALAASAVSFGRCCVEPPEELDRLSFL